MRRASTTLVALLCGGFLSATAATALPLPNVTVTYDLSGTTLKALGLDIVPTAISGEMTIVYTADSTGLTILDGPVEFSGFTLFIEDLDIPSVATSLGALVDATQTGVAAGDLSGTTITGGTGQTIDAVGATGSGVFTCTGGACSILPPLPINLEGPIPIDIEAVDFELASANPGPSTVTGTIQLDLLSGTPVDVILDAPETGRVAPEPGAAVLLLAGAAGLAVGRRRTRA